MSNMSSKSVLGRGLLGTTYLSEENGRPITEKHCHFTSFSPQNTVLNAIFELKESFHTDFCPGILHCEADQQQQCIIIKNEYCNKGSLEKFLKDCRPTPSQIFEVLEALVHAVAYLHSKTVNGDAKPFVHGNLKPKNILFHCSESEEIHVKVGDLWSYLFNNENCTTSAGQGRNKDMFTAPEVFENSYDIRQASDVFSLGLIMCAVLLFSITEERISFYAEKTWPEFKGKKKTYGQVMYEEKLKKRPEQDVLPVMDTTRSSRVPQLLQELINQMTRRDPDARPTMQVVKQNFKQIKEALEAEEVGKNIDKILENWLAASEGDQERVAADPDYNDTASSVNTNTILNSDFIGYFEPEELNTYPQTGNQLVVIFALFTEDLKGYRKDVTDLENLFHGFLGYEVRSGDGFTNLCRKDLLDKLQEVRKEVYETKKYDGLVITILSHGDHDGIKTCSNRGGIVEEDKARVKPGKVVEIFRDEDTNTMETSDIPKFFIYQFCRVDSGWREAADSEEGKPSINLTSSDPDVIIAYSCAKGKTSLVNQSKGSAFIQSLTEVFKRNCERLSVAQMLTLVQGNVASREKEVDGRTISQMPCHYSTLRKELFLKPVDRPGSPFT